MSVLREKYEKEIAPSLMSKYSYKSPMQIPKLEKVVVNIGVGEAKENAKALESAVADLTAITGQKPIITKARKSVAAFKLREGMNIGARLPCAARECTSLSKGCSTLRFRGFVTSEVSTRTPLTDAEIIPWASGNS